MHCGPMTVPNESITLLSLSRTVYNFKNNCSGVRFGKMFGQSSDGLFLKMHERGTWAKISKIKNISLAHPRHAI